MKTKVTKSYILINIALLFVISLFIFLVSYSRPPIGDDVLSQFKNGISCYLDEKESCIGNQVANIYDCLQIAKENYLSWGGRLLGFFLGGIRSLVGDIVISIFTTIIYLGIILFSCRIVRKSWENVLLHPLDYILLFLVYFYLNISIDFLLMWTMISIYSLSVFLILLYGIIQDRLYLKAEKNFVILILYNFLGLVTGITQEIYVVLICVFLLIQFIIQREKRFQIFKYNIGFVIGSVICFFSPGNYNRSLQSHESALKLTYFNRLKSNIIIHIKNLAGIRHICAYIIIIFFIFLCYKLIRYKNIKIHKILYYWAGLLGLSVFGWSIVTIPNGYSTLFFIVFAWIIILQIYVDNSKNVCFISEIKLYIISFIFLIIFITYNYTWLHSNLRTRNKWNKLIKKAVSNNETIVNVPKFDEQFSNRFNMQNFNNLDFEYSFDYYLKYYKTKVVPK